MSPAQRLLPMIRAARVVARHQRAKFRQRLIVDVIRRETAAELARRNVSARLQVLEVDHIPHRWDAIYRRVDDGFRLELPRIARLETAEKAGFLGPTYLYWLSQCGEEVQKIVVTLSDGDQPTLAQFSPSTNQRHVTPLPDPFFYRSDAFSGMRAFAEQNDVVWSSRSHDITWRGSSSGHGTFDPILARECPSRATQRILLCLAAKDLPGVDIALSSYLRDEFDPELLLRQGLIRDRIHEQSWIGRKFAVDVDGQTNTWSNLITRLHLGCCVLKVDSREGYRQWYYDQLRPWEHFVPVKADLSDLAEQIDWVRSHDDRAADIAANGRAVARSLDFASARDDAVRRIQAHWREAVYP